MSQRSQNSIKSSRADVTCSAHNLILQFASQRRSPVPNSAAVLRVVVCFSGAAVKFRKRTVLDVLLMRVETGCAACVCVDDSLLMRSSAVYGSIERAHSF